MANEKELNNVSIQQIEYRLNEFEEKQDIIGTSIWDLANIVEKVNDSNNSRFRRLGIWIGFLLTVTSILAIVIFIIQNEISTERELNNFSGTFYEKEYKRGDEFLLVEDYIYGKIIDEPTNRFKNWWSFGDLKEEQIN